MKNFSQPVLVDLACELGKVKFNGQKHEWEFVWFVFKHKNKQGPTNEKANTY